MWLIWYCTVALSHPPLSGKRTWPASRCLDAPVVFGWAMSARKRARVSSALHSELSEYSSLLRALRTSNTLDLAFQLTTHASTTSAAHHSDEDVDVEPIDDEDGESELPLTDSVAWSQQSAIPSENSGDLSVLRESQQTLKQKTTKADLRRPRDTWTRWPLLSGDVHVPEWSLEDEVALLANQYLNVHGDDSPCLPISLGTTAGLPDADNFTGSNQPHDLEDAESSLAPHTLHALTESTARYLSQILALLAAYVPSAEESMQNRVRPLDWENVLSIIATNGLLDPE